MPHHRLSPLLSLCLCAQTPTPFQESALRAHIAFLADDLLEGRGTGQRGGALTVRYLEAQLQALGLRPAFGTSYRQPIHLLGLRTDFGASHLAILNPDGSRWTLHPPFDVVFGSGLAEPRTTLSNELVFVGYGIREGLRDDFKDMDLRGKVWVALAGPAPEGREGCCEPRQHAGRWDVKFTEARARGAAGLLLIHRASDASYGWEVVQVGWARERFQPLTPPGPVLQGWLSESAGQRLLQAAGIRLEDMIQEAGRLDFRPRPLGLRLEGQLHSKIRNVVEYNVGALIPGRDPALAQEVLILSAHWDHLGKEEGTGAIHPGAVDNATGCAGLLALAQSLSQQRPARSILVLFTAAEEHGLLGAKAYVQAPAFPLERTVAALNLESLNVAGPTRDIGLAGCQGSTLQDRALAVAQRMGLRPMLPRTDPQSLFFRADHFAFVQAGIPAFSPGFSLDGGWDYLDPEAARRARRFLEEAYHRPQDRYDPNWDLRGLLQQLDFFQRLALDLANHPERPRWHTKAPVFKTP